MVFVVPRAEVLENTGCWVAILCIANLLGQPIHLVSPCTGSGLPRTMSGLAMFMDDKGHKQI